VEVNGWAAAEASAEQPEWILVVDRTGQLVAWGASRVRRDDVGRALGLRWGARGFIATGREAVDGPLAVVAAFEDGRRCLLDAAVQPAAEFIAALPEGARPASEEAWTVGAGTHTARTGPDPVPEPIRPAVGTLGPESHLIAHIDLAVPAHASALAVPVRTAAFPFATTLVVRDTGTNEVIARHDFRRGSDDGWVWRVFAETADPRFAGRALRVEVATAGPRAELGIAVGRPYWLPETGPDRVSAD
jgi:hypothetical protein